MASSKKFVIREITLTTPITAESDNCGTCALLARHFSSVLFTSSPAVFFCKDENTRQAHMIHMTPVT
jgi:hypothetical protein